MRIGTFLCWLIGHKFIATKDEYLYTGGIFDPHKRTIMIERTDFCVRCGIDKPAYDKGTRNPKEGDRQ